MSATELLEQAREARGAGDVSLCMEKVSAAVTAADQERDTLAAYHAHACAGRLYLSRCDPTGAQKHFKDALHAAGVGGLVDWLAPAYHDLYIAYREGGNEARCKRYCGTAFDLYRDFSPKHYGLTGLIADMAQAEFDLNPTRDRAAHALQAWRPAMEALPVPHYRLAAAAHAMRAAAVLDLRSRYENAAAHLDREFSRLPHHEHAAATLVYAADACRLYRDYGRAVRLAEDAERIAEQRTEDLIRQRAVITKDKALTER